ncbi:hypothetical protein L596_011525 [Steinernema carpocapsae]|uniref:Amino acid transporter transmembrane domain-containing protein n=2 Tax=Steinernema carpocapsae TaxID=34508 RepID=A0A4V6A4I3_STECR|nr:hypothetical protein L596_011525 [Steinernema carpocapsae]
MFAPSFFRGSEDCDGKQGKKEWKRYCSCGGWESGYKLPKHNDVDLKLNGGIAPPAYKKSSISSSEESPNHSTTIINENGQIENLRGLHWFITGLFVVGDMAGGGLVALPTAMIQSNFWVGLIITSVMTVVATYSAYCLGRNWVIMQNMWPEYRDHCRKPYAEMGYRALGPKMKTIVSVCIDITQFGIAVVYLLLASKNIHDSIKAFSNGFELNFCYVILIVATCLLPITFLKSPQDFWWAVVLAMVTTTVAVILVVLGSAIDYGTCHPYHHMPNLGPTNYFVAMGTFLFSYGGHSAFPTIQHDMRKPYEFTKSALMAFAIMEVMYIPVCVIGYLTYGDSLRDSIINSIQTVWIQQAINLLITIHCILTLTIVFNPINQEVEEIFKVPQHFGVKRVIVRTSMMVAVVFVAESLPTFGPLLNLMGGSTVTLTSIVFPCLFYMCIVVAEKKAEYCKKGESLVPTLREVIEKTPRITLIACVAAMIFGLLGGAAATYSAIRELATTQFTPPCYVTPFIHHDNSNIEKGHTSCCGQWSNITWHSNQDSCSPYKSYYE